MKQFILIGFFVMTYSTAFSQKHIYGKIINTNAEPLRGIKIGNGDNSGYYQISKKNGEFRILKPTKQGRTMTVFSRGYETVRIGNIDTISHPITIVMKEQPFYFIYGNNYNNFTLSLQADGMRVSFYDFESILGKENIDNLNNVSSVGLEYAFAYKGLYFALNHGHVFHNNVELDSSNAKKGDYRTFLLGTHFGYNIINSKRFLITPKVGIKWYRNRIINYDNEWRIPIEQYLTNKDLDIRFNHLIGFTGVSCSYKSYIDEVASWVIGFYGGYSFKFNDNPWIYSGNNRLITDKKVEFSNFNFGITLSLFFNLY